MKPTQSPAQILERLVSSAANAAAARDTYHFTALELERAERSDVGPVRTHEREQTVLAITLAALAAEFCGVPGLRTESAITFQPGAASPGRSGYEQRLRAALEK